jgi:hypothetical protein
MQDNLNAALIPLDEQIQSTVTAQMMETVFTGPRLAGGRITRRNPTDTFLLVVDHDYAMMMSYAIE